jgi:hypothetical protein
MYVTEREAADRFALRHSISPYIGLPIILVPVLGLMVFVSLKEHDWTPFLAMQSIWIFCAIWAFIVSRYRIFWRDGVIVQKASGKADVSIKGDEITRVEQETSNVGTLVRFNRPFRRIVIYAEKPHSEGKFIDVSLKHFVADDVRKLMRTIHARRPDLALPKHWT